MADDIVHGGFRAKRKNALERELRTQVLTFPKFDDSFTTFRLDFSNLMISCISASAFQGGLQLLRFNLDRQL